MKFARMSNLHCGGNGVFSGEFDMPLECPHCHTAVYKDPSAIHELPLNTEDTAVFVGLECPVCRKHYIVVFKRDRAKKQLDFVQMIPISEEKMEFPGLFDLSPRFEKYHRQALTAYSMGFTELAIVGFRTALEFLIKDFAITEENADARRTGDATFNEVVKEYMGHLAKSSNVVRVLGNDYTHYREKHPDIPAETTFKYYRIVLNEMNNRYLMNHTPLEE